MRLHGVSLCAGCLLALLFGVARAGQAAEASPAPDLPRMTADQLYKAYEALNTPANLKWRFPGGQPPNFIQEQLRILAELASRNTDDASRVLLRLADQYLARIGKLTPKEFKRSPLSILQFHLIQLLGARVDQPRFRVVFQRFVKSPTLNDSARARVILPLIEFKLRAIDPAKDPNGSKRGALIFSEMLGKLSFSDCIHVSARFSGVASLARTAFGSEPGRQWDALSAAADSVPRRYARDFSFVVACSALGGNIGELSAQNRARLAEIAGRWAREYKPLVDKETNPSDSLAIALRALAEKKGNEDLARLMPPAQAQPTPPLETPKPVEAPKP